MPNFIPDYLKYPDGSVKNYDPTDWVDAEGAAAGVFGLGVAGAAFAADHYFSGGYEKYLPDAVKSVEDLASRLPDKLKGDAQQLLNRFYKGSGVGKTPFGSYIRVKDAAGKSYRNASGAVTDVKGNPLNTQGKTVAKSAPTPNPVKPIYSKGVGGSNLGFQMKGGVAKVGSIGLKALRDLVLLVLGGITVLGSLVDTSADLIQSMQRGEGYAAIPGMVVDLLSSDEEQQAEKVAIPDTPEVIAERRERMGMSNIPPAEGMLNNPMYGQQTDLSVYQGESGSQQQVEPEIEEQLIPRSRPPMMVTPDEAIFEEDEPQAYSAANDPRNAEYIAARDALGPNATHGNV